MARTYSRDVREADKYRLSNKFTSTAMLVDNDEWIREELRSYAKDFTTETPNLEFEQGRTNTDNTRNIHLNSRYGNGIDVHQADLFLGDMTRDPRGTDTQPLMSNYKKQMWDRKDNFRKAFVDDETRSAFLGVKPQCAIQKAKNDTFYGFKSRFKNFGIAREITPRLSNVVESNVSMVGKSRDERRRVEARTYTARSKKSSFMDHHNVDYSKRTMQSKEVVPSSAPSGYDTTENKMNSEMSQKSKKSLDATVRKTHQQTIADLIKSRRLSMSNASTNRPLGKHTEVGAKSAKKSNAHLSRDQLYGQKTKEELVSMIMSNKQNKNQQDVNQYEYTQKKTNSRESAQRVSRFTNPAAISNSLRLTDAVYKTGREREAGVNTPFVKHMFDKRASAVFDIKHRPTHVIFNYGTLIPHAGGKTRENLSEVQIKEGRVITDTARPARRSEAPPNVGDNLYGQTHGTTKEVHPAGRIGNVKRMVESAGKTPARLTSIVDTERVDIG